MKYFLCILSLAASPAFATADGPDTFRVRGVKVGDVLNLREGHSASARIISKIPRDATTIKNLGENWPKYDSDAPPSKETLADRNDLTQEEKQVLLKGLSWCKVEYLKKQGWALCKYLGE
ncbi:MAG: hypothetical protein ACJ763_08075 [Bdellovibrionia bacterium]